MSWCASEGCHVPPSPGIDGTWDRAWPLDSSGGQLQSASLRLSAPGRVLSHPCPRYLRMPNRPRRLLWFGWSARLRVNIEPDLG
jgi:hypothetical protein